MRLPDHTVVPQADLMRLLQSAYSGVGQVSWLSHRHRFSRRVGRQTGELFDHG
jgi:hypothetical protein